MSQPIRCAPDGPLPSKQAAVLEFIAGELRRGAKFPSNREIADHMGWKTEGSAYDCLCRLEWRGKVIRRNANGRVRHRALRYTWEVVPS